MTDAICVLDRSRRDGLRTTRRRLRSLRSVRDALAHTSAGQVWVLSSRGLASKLIRAMGSAPPGVRRARLVSYSRPEPVSARVIESGFDRVLLGAGAMVSFEELVEILSTDHPEDHCVGAEWDETTNTVALWRGDLSVLVVPMEVFAARSGVVPDPTRLAVLDHGQTLRLGDYEASIDAILFERDPDHRRRARKRMIEEEQGLGPSIWRLRIARGLTRADFPPLREKTIARIERGEVERPHRRTLETISRRIGVPVDELGEH